MKFWLILFLISVASMIFAQNKTLVIRNDNYFKRVSFYVGDPIRFYVKQDKIPLSGRITALTDSGLSYHFAIVIDDQEGYAREEHDATVLLKDISGIMLKEQKRKSNIGTKEIAAYVGGFGLFMVGQSIYTWIRDSEPNLPYLITGASIFSLAQIPNLVKRRKYVMGKKWSLSVITY